MVRNLECHASCGQPKMFIEEQILNNCRCDCPFITPRIRLETNFLDVCAKFVANQQMQPHMQ